ncbi:FtsX-like permease family protein [Paenibacillus sp.]|uniref:FtsX-like permease family protein n=1 Tax=Paenibacillus sp. TaxID=58172 RepID=UPI002D4BE6FF|nr:FtsX-like permease family protein [Paenibacillus sp.]HZG57430.1 FtsX-like permease family protein [Paenibacillus sp.]
MNLWNIAWRNLMRRKLRTLLTVVSIVIGVASAFAVIASVDSAKKAFPLYLKEAFGKADFSIYGTDATFSADVLHDVEHVEGGTAIATIMQATKMIVEDERVTEIQKRVDLKGYSRLDTPLTGYKVVSGSLAGGGAVITDRTARVWNASVGDTIALDTDTGVQTVRIDAIVAYTVDLMGPSSWTMAKYHPWTVAVPLPLVQAWFDREGEIESVQIKALPGADKARLEAQLKALAMRDGSIYMQPFVLDVDAQYRGADTFFLALYIAGCLGIALSAFVIFNSMYVSIQERRNEFAAMKTIGYTPEQLRRFVLYEVILLSAVGTVVGLLIGFGLAQLLKAAIFMIFGVHEESGIELTKGLVVSILAGLIVPIAASLTPIRNAGKTSVIAALKESRSASTALPRWRAAAGLLLIVSALFIKHLLLVVPLLLGVALVFPYLFRGFAALLKPIYKLLFGFAGVAASRNLERNLVRTSATSVILCLGIAMILLMSSLNSALIQTYERVIHASYGGNLDVMLHHIEPTDLEALKRTEGVADAQTYPVYAAVWTLDGHVRKLGVYGVGADWIDRFPMFTANGEKQSELIGSLTSDELVLDRVAFKVWGGAVGETLTLDTLRGPKEFKVVSVVETMKNNGYGAFMAEEHFRDSFGLKYERNALVLKEEGVSPLQLRENIFDTFGSRIESMFGPEDWVSIIGATYTGSFSVVNFLVVLSIVISGIGLANTMLMNVMERIRELGMMRAVGVARGQIVRTVMLEGFGIGLAATVIGLVFGVLLIYMTSTFLEVNTLTYRFGVSWTILTLVCAFGLLVSLLASYAPASRAAKTPLSEALRYE